MRIYGISTFLFGYSEKKSISFVWKILAPFLQGCQSVDHSIFVQFPNSPLPFPRQMGDFTGRDPSGVCWMWAELARGCVVSQSSLHHRARSKRNVLDVSRAGPRLCCVAVLAPSQGEIQATWPPIIEPGSYRSPLATRIARDPWPSGERSRPAIFSGPGQAFSFPGFGGPTQITLSGFLFI